MEGRRKSGGGEIDLMGGERKRIVRGASEWMTMFGLFASDVAIVLKKLSSDNRNVGEWSSELN